MTVSLNEQIAGRFLDGGGFAVNIRHPDIGAVGDGNADDGSILMGLPPGYYLVPPGRYRVARSGSTGREVTLVFARGAMLQLDGGAQLTIRGGIHAGLFQVFSGPGEVRFGPGTIEYAYAHWWGAAGDGTGDDTLAIRAALAAHDIVKLPSGSYPISDTIRIGASHFLIGDAFGRANAGGPTVWVAPAAQDGWPDGKPVIALAGEAGTECGVSGIRVQGWTDYFTDDQASAGPVAIDCQNAYNSCLVEYVGIEKCRTALMNRPNSRWVISIRNVQVAKCAEVLAWACNNGKFYDVSCRTNRSMGRVDGGQNAFYGCHFENESGRSTFRLAGQVLLSGCWLESNRHHFDAADRLNLTVVSSHFGSTNTAGEGPSYEHGLGYLGGRDIEITVIGSFIRASRMGWIYRATAETLDVSITHLNVRYDDVINRYYWDGSRSLDPRVSDLPGLPVSHRELGAGSREPADA